MLIEAIGLEALRPASQNCRELGDSHGLYRCCFEHNLTQTISKFHKSNAVHGGKQNYIIRKFVTKTDVVNAGKQDDIIRRFQKSDALRAGKQNDIIQKFQKSDVVQVEESKPT